MNDPHTTAKRKLSQILVAALTVHPLDPGLSEDELKTAALRFGIAPAIFEEVLSKFWDWHSEERFSGVVVPASSDLMLLGVGGGYPPAIPMTAVDRLGRALTRLDERHGTRSTKTLEMLISECGGSEHDTKVALGFLLTHKHVERVSGGFRQCERYAEGSFGKNNPNHPSTEALSKAAAIVETIFVTAAPLPS